MENFMKTKKIRKIFETNFSSMFFFGFHVILLKKSVVFYS